MFGFLMSAPAESAINSNSHEHLHLDNMAATLLPGSWLLIGIQLPTTPKGSLYIISHKHLRFVKQSFQFLCLLLLSHCLLVFAFYEVYLMKDLNHTCSLSGDTWAWQIELAHCPGLLPQISEEPAGNGCSDTATLGWPLPSNHPALCTLHGTFPAIPFTAIACEWLNMSLSSTYMYSV